MDEEINNMNPETAAKLKRVIKIQFTTPDGKLFDSELEAIHHCKKLELADYFAKKYLQLIYGEATFKDDVPIYDMLQDLKQKETELFG